MQNKAKIEWISVYNCLLDVCNTIKKRGKLRFLHIFLMGSRASGKTHAVMQSTALTFLLPRAKLQINTLRKTDKAVSRKTRELFGILNKMGYTQNDFDWKKGEKTLTNEDNGAIYMFDYLNDEKFSPNEGAKLEVPITLGVDYIINFFEEANEMHPTLVDQYTLSCRGEKDVQVLNIYAANPYQRTNWYTTLFNKYLPESESEMREKGYQYKEVPEFENGNGAIFLRTNVYINPFVSKATLNKLESLEEVNRERWKIVCLGLCGDVGNMVYTNSMRKVSRELNSKNIQYGELVAGFDYGWGTGANSSLSYGCIGFYDMERGVDIVDELVHSNATQMEWDLTTTIHNLIEFLDKYRRLYRKPIKCFVDNAHDYDFYQKFNYELYKFGLTTLDIEFLPAEKPETQRRIQSTKYIMETGKVRITNKCKQLIDDFINCHYEEVKNPKEGQKYERSHENTHSINAFEYLLSHKWDEIASNNIYYFDKVYIDD